MNLPLLSIVMPTRNRAHRLRRTLHGLAAQLAAPAEVLVVEGGDDPTEAARLEAEFGGTLPGFRAVKAELRGAAPQRNQGVALARGDVIGFCDDDLDFEPGCIGALRAFLAERADFGGVSATLTNQAPRGFGRLTRAVTALMDTYPSRSLDGRVVGPALNFLPSLSAEAPPVCETEWLNTTCTFYRRSVLPVPPFDACFQGYSMMEDVCLSLRVAALTRLAVLSGARVFHDTQPGDHKRSAAELGAMSVRNRYYVATRVLGRPATISWVQLAVWQGFCALSGMRHLGAEWARTQWGAAAALAAIALGGEAR
jgi:hypothetical protein